MEIHKYNRLKIVLAEKERTGTWLSEQMGHSISTVSRWMTNKVQPSVERGTTLRDSTPSRRGCEGIIGVVEVTLNMKAVDLGLSVYWGESLLEIPNKHFEENLFTWGDDSYNYAHNK